ncbi:MAG: ornithine carbamoyltransferase [Planctomycetia bacterium]|nr:ornithine carbamoyltransferase [Planctomycetia bacterium]
MKATGRHFITLSDVRQQELDRIFDLARTLKADMAAGKRPKLLEGRVLGLIFEKMSLRTRVSFEAGMAQLGGATIFLEDQHIGFGKRESVADISRVLSSMVDAIAFRAKKHSSVTQLASYSYCPVINALTDRAHPCQALADLLTIQEEFGHLNGLRIAWVGDSNNVAASLIAASAMMGAQVVVSSPADYQFSSEEVARLTAVEKRPGFSLEFEPDPKKAVAGADVIYTDVWVSMGQESEEAVRCKVFAPYQVNGDLMAATGKKETIFLHCLPARRGLEVTDEVMDGPQSRIVEQAANRMHAQKGLLVWLMTEAKADA